MAKQGVTRAQLRRPWEQGFSLIELLIVVAIILIIAAIAIPNLVKAKMAANETSAAAQVRLVSTIEMSYANTCGGYAMTMAKLGPASPENCDNGMGLVDNSIGVDGTVYKSGFKFIYTPAPGGTLTSNGVTVGVDFVYGGEPIAWNSTGRKSYCSTPEPSVVRGSSGSALVAVPTTIAACSGSGAQFAPVN
jgi:type IV pilus assembly protein PilA